MYISERFYTKTTWFPLNETPMLTLKSIYSNMEEIVYGIRVLGSFYSINMITISEI